MRPFTGRRRDANPLLMRRQEDIFTSSPPLGFLSTTRSLPERPFEGRETPVVFPLAGAKHRQMNLNHVASSSSYPAEELHGAGPSALLSPVPAPCLSVSPVRRPGALDGTVAVYALHIV